MLLLSLLWTFICLGLRIGNVSEVPYWVIFAPLVIFLIGTLIEVIISSPQEYEDYDPTEDSFRN